MKKLFVIARLLLFIVTGFLCIEKSFSQQVNVPSVLPPSPQANALIAYNSPEIGLFTGTAQLSIPIFKLNNKNFSLPIELKYATNGLKVDEIATRTGQSWVLNAGGVIIRNVNGKPDEYNTRINPPNEGTTLNQEMLDYLKAISSPNNKDSEPDEFVFNFNGYNGKFIIDENGIPIIMPHSNLKILYPGGVDPKITIVTPDGIKYEFNDREKSYLNSDCYLGLNPVLSPVTTAWYLSRIIFLNNNFIQFDYDDTFTSYSTGISQSILKSDNISNQGVYCGDNQCSQNTTTYCNNRVLLFGKRLSQIIFDNTSVVFSYQDRLDLSGDKLLNTVQIKQSNELINKFTFGYEYAISNGIYSNQYNNQDPALIYRPFLKTLTEGGSSNGQKIHQFKYNDIQSLPQRLSFSQDNFGYFNGKINAGFIQNVDEPYIHNLFVNEATADRSIDVQYSGKGILTKIVYPTGGSDSLIYEGNTYAEQITLPAPTEVKGITATSSSNLPFIRNSALFQINYDYPSKIKLYAGMIIPTDQNGNPSVDTNADLMLVNVIRSSDNSIIYSQSLKYGEQINETPNFLSLNTSYYLQIQILYAGIRGICNITYPSGNEIISTVNKPAGGLRLSKLISESGTGNFILKKYYYSNIDSLEKSSGVKFNDPVYVQQADAIIAPCTVVGTYAKCKNFLMTSDSQKSIYNYGQSTLQYTSVTESLGGEHFENGAIEHCFITEKDRFAKGLIGTTLSLGIRYSNTGYLNGLEKETNYFKKMETGYQKLKQIINHYSISNLINKTVPAYGVVRHFEPPYQGALPLQIEFDGYEMYKYTFNSRWVVLDSTTTIEYSSQLHPVYFRQSYEFGNSSHLQPTAISTPSSQNAITKLIKIYPAEMISQGRDYNGVYSAMVNANVLTPIVEELKKIDDENIEIHETEYYQPYEGIFMPHVEKFWNNKTNFFESRLFYNNYDQKGNLLNVSLESGPKTSYLYSYNSQYPIAEIKNSDYGLVEMVLGGSAAVNNFSNSSPTDQQVNDFINPLRISPLLKDAQITSYTYKPLIGMTSQTNARGITIYYEYDAFQRLQSVKDQNQHIVKSYDYHFKP